MVGQHAQLTHPVSAATSERARAVLAACMAVALGLNYFSGAHHGCSTFGAASDLLYCPAITRVASRT